MENDDLIYRKTAKEMFLHAPMTEDEKILVFLRLNAVPAVDAVEVVTCDICVHHVDDGCLYCTKLGMLCPDAKFYCKYGKRQNYGGCRKEEHNASD